MPSIDSLKCFLAAARFKNFRAASRSVALSPAAFGQRIRQLEDEIAAPLFSRTTRSVVLTQVGLDLIPHAQHAISAIDNCLRSARGDLSHAPVDLVLGTRHELGLSWVVPMIPLLEKKFPQLTLHCFFGSGQDLVARVHSAALDCAVTSSRITDPKLDSFRLHEERYVFVGQSQLLAQKPLSSPKEAKQHTLFDTTEELPLFRYWRDSKGGIDSLEFSQVRRLGTIAAIHQMVLAGRGVAVLPAYFVEKDLRAKRLTQIMPRVKPVPDYFRLVFRTDDPRRSFFQQLADAMRSTPLR